MHIFYLYRVHMYKYIAGKLGLRIWPVRIRMQQIFIISPSVIFQPQVQKAKKQWCQQHRSPDKKRKTAMEKEKKQAVSCLIIIGVVAYPTTSTTFPILFLGGSGGANI